VLLTRLPLGIATPFDLHVLGTPPALVLSQDQTLHKKLYEAFDKGSILISYCTKSRDPKDIVSLTLSKTSETHRLMRLLYCSVFKERMKSRGNPQSVSTDQVGAERL
jgi:hypothetical protein